MSYQCPHRRGYTDLSQQMDSAKLNEMLHSFYDHCSAAVWEKDGIINKFIGDAVLAIFNFPLVREEHVANAVSAAFELRKTCRQLKEEIGLGNEKALNIGMGIHTGDCFMGEVGTSYKDFTAVGPVVNLASRLQGAAGPGEILVTADVFQQVKDQFPDAESRTLSLKGISSPVEVYNLAG